jgi:PAS domain S-box-containing protein
MPDERKTQAELEAELTRLSQEAADLRAALAAEKASRPVEGMPGDYDLLFETLAEALLVVRVRDGLILRANPCCRRLLGLAEGNLAGKTLYHLLPEAARPRAEAVIREAAAGSRLIPQREAMYRRPDGTNVAIEVGGAILGDEPDTAALLHLTDITKNVDAQRLLRETEQRYRLVVDSAGDPIFVLNRRAQFTAVNPAAARAFHCRPEDLVGKTMQEIFPPEVAERQWQQVKKVFDTGEPLFSEENESQTAEGPRWYNTSLTPIRNEGGEVQFVLGIARDVTDRKRVEAALRESQQELQAVQDMMVDGILIADAETRRFVHANPAMCRMLGYTQDELLTKSVEDIHPRDRLSEVLRLFDAQVRGEIPFAGDVPCLRKDGSVFHAEISTSRITLGGRPCAMGVFRDVAERRKAEESLRESEAELRSVQDAMVDALVIVDIETQRLVRLNPAAYRMFGYEPGELDGAPVHAIHPPEDVEFTNLQFQNRFQGIFNPVSEIRCRRKDGTVFVADMNAAPITIRGRRCTMGAFRDITERKKAEEALRQSEENYRLLFESNMNGIAIIGPDGRIVRANNAYCDIHRFPPEKITGMSLWDLVAPHHREDLRQRHEALFRGEITAYSGNFRIVRGDGTAGWVEVIASRMTWEGRPARLAIVQDITERVRLENELHQAQKMEAVGQLAGGIAHDFNNLLTGILCSAQFLKAGPGISKDVYETADVIEKAARRAAELTGQLLGFARRGKHQDVPVDLGATIRSVIRLLGSAVDPRIRFAARAPLDPWRSRPDGTGGAEPGDERPGRNVGQRAADLRGRPGRTCRRRLCRPATRQTGPVRRPARRRYRLRHTRRNPRPHLRPVFHHQARRQGHRHGPGDGLRHCPQPRRLGRGG